MPHRFPLLTAVSFAVLALSFAGNAGAQEPTRSDTVEAIAISPDGKWLASGGASKVVAHWDIDQGSVLQNLAGHSEAVRALSFSPDGKLLASSSNDGTVKVWETWRVVDHCTTSATIGRSAASSSAATVQLWSVLMLAARLSSGTRAALRNCADSPVTADSAPSPTWP
jgi:WD40 repeat protein